MSQRSPTNHNSSNVPPQPASQARDERQPGYTIIYQNPNFQATSAANSSHSVPSGANSQPAVYANYEMINNSYSPSRSGRRKRKLGAGSTNSASKRARIYDVNNSIGIPYIQYSPTAHAQIHAPPPSSSPASPAAPSVTSHPTSLKAPLHGSVAATAEERASRANASDVWYFTYPLQSKDKPDNSVGFGPTYVKKPTVQMGAFLGCRLCMYVITAQIVCILSNALYS
jgi:hypothetical protein